MQDSELDGDGVCHPNICTDSSEDDESDSDDSGEERLFKNTTHLREFFSMH